MPQFEQPEPAIDPSWWRDIVAGKPDHARSSQLSLALSAAAGQHPDGTARAVLQTLATATSAMLRPDRWNDPFDPLSVMNGRRTLVPADLDDDARELLRRVADAMDDTDSPSLRARVCDVTWFYGDRANTVLLDQAIASYACVPLEQRVWQTDGQTEWQRGLELASRKGKAAAEQRVAMGRALRDRLDTVTAEDGFFGVQLEQMIRENRLVPPAERATFGTFCAERAAEARGVGNRRLEREWEQECAAWFQAAGEHDDARAAQVRRADSFAAEAQDRRDGPSGQQITAGSSVESAIKALLELPRSYRVEHGIDDRIGALRKQLEADREHLMENMIPIRGGSIDLAEMATEARTHVSGRDRFHALVALGTVDPLPTFTRAVERARADIVAHPLTHLFGNETYAGSGQKVASTPAADLNAPDVDGVIDDVTWSEMVRDFTIRVSVMVPGRILPPLDLITSEHRFPVGLLYQVCRENPVIPAGHELTYARGLLHGLDHDFISAASVLVPQVENIVRVMLKRNDVHTLHTGDQGVETEKGLTALLADPSCPEILGQDLWFEWKALLTAQQGPNLRNTVAHGLAGDATLRSEAPVYLWWHALRLAVLPWAGDDVNDQSDPVDPVVDRSARGSEQGSRSTGNESHGRTEQVPDEIR